MTDINRLRATWSGSGVVGPGVSTFYALGTGSALSAAVADLFTDLVAALPVSVNITIPGGGEVIEDSTGATTGTWTSGGGGVISGTDPGAFSQGVGIRMVWETAGLTNNRRVRGSTFMCPLAGNVFANDGTPASGARTVMTDAAIAFVSSLVGDLVIWTKPTDSTPGKISEVTSGTVPDRVSWLTSRRT